MGYMLFLDEVKDLEGIVKKSLRYFSQEVVWGDAVFAGSLSQVSLKDLRKLAEEL
jgi:hypothetical protein